MSANRIVTPQNYSLQRTLLVAAPSWDNQWFRRSVCLVVHHSLQGAVGVFLNRSMEVDAAGLWAQLSGSKPALNQPATENNDSKERPRLLHFGGPKSGPVVAIHNQAEFAEFASADGVYFAAQLSHLQQLLSKSVDDAELKIIVGQADWPAGELEEQFAAGCWLPLPVLPKLVFEESPFMWARAVREVGNRFVVGLTGAHGQPDNILAN